MRKSIVIACIVFYLGALSALAWADETRDHICFRVLDADKDGFVTVQEFEKYYGKDRKKFDAADGNKDGKLTHAEYHHLLGHGAAKKEPQS